ncbi:MAG: YlmC/YmxH family sporulation protein [Clostridia bacterium]|nr:YlmC/YmxH family sporulation protein [Clostridia bacterium]
MLCRIGDLRNRDVISIRDGSRIGVLGDLEIDTVTAALSAIVVYGRPRLFGLLGHEEDSVIPWSAVTTVGEDTVLVDFTIQRRPAKRGILANFWEKT